MALASGHTKDQLMGDFLINFFPKPASYFIFWGWYEGL